MRFDDCYYIMNKGQQPKNINAKKKAVEPAKQVQSSNTPILNYACLVKCEVMEHSNKEIDHCPKYEWYNMCMPSHIHTNQYVCILHLAIRSSSPYIRMHYFTLYDIKSKKRTRLIG